MTALNSSPISTLRPDGELSEMFAFGSKNTNLQRESKLKEITGQVVQWKLPVYEVSRSGEGYKVQTTAHGNAPEARDMIETFVYVTPRDEAERKIIEALKTGDVISVKGQISGSTMRSLELRPAVLEFQTSHPAPQPTLASIPETPVRDFSSLLNQPPESALDEPVLKDKFKSLLGDKAEKFRERLNVSSGINQEGEWLVGEGAIPHLFSIEEAAFAVNSHTGEIFAIMLNEGTNLSWFGTAEISKLPAPLIRWYKEHGGT